MKVFTAVVLLFLLTSLSIVGARRYHTRKSLDADTTDSLQKDGKRSRATREDQDFWNATGQNEIIKILDLEFNTNKAKNVILFLGDGMGNPSVVAARIFKGQRESGIGSEEGTLEFETFPNVAYSKTYCVDSQVADSACSGTAYLTGVKTNIELVGVDSAVVKGDCSSVTNETKVSSIASWALNEGKRTGFVTTTRVTHATPAASYAHSAHRDWECDQDIEEFIAICPTMKDIARQLVEDEPGRSFNVIMGGGYQVFVGNATDNAGDFVDEEICQRQDGLDLFQQWQTDRAEEGKNYVAVRTKSELMAADLTGVENLMGIFSNSHVPYEYATREQNLDIPTLSDMTSRAIEVLQQDDDGFFLLVEGGRIDHGHHETIASRALDETLAFEEAIQTAMTMVDISETLIVVTADHSHTMTINGYPTRGNDILGSGDLGDDGLPYLTLSYANGPGFNFTTNATGSVVRWDLTSVNTSTYDYVQPSAVYRELETHAGEDVGIYAIGPMSHLFRGVHEQHYIAHVMGYAACMGPNKDHCNSAETFRASLPLLFAVSCLVAARNFFTRPYLSLFL